MQKHTIRIDEDLYREIEEYSQVLNEGSSDEKLSHIVEDSGSHAYTGH